MWAEAKKTFSARFGWNWISGRTSIRVGTGERPSDLWQTRTSDAPLDRTDYKT